MLSRLCCRLRLAGRLPGRYAARPKDTSRYSVDYVKSSPRVLRAIGSPDQGALQVSGPPFAVRPILYLFCFSHHFFLHLMIFAIREGSSDLKPLVSFWSPKELELERYILPNADSDDPILNEVVFGEPLLLVSNQVGTRAKKRADILALDQLGNGVIVELKRGRGVLGVETQALQYLADFSSSRGADFIERFSRYHRDLENNVRGFIGDGERLENLNRRSRIILLARGFDPSIYSMGKWLGENGVAFRCVTYTPFEIDGDRFLSFSLAFDQSPGSIYPLSFQTRARGPEYYWHNIGVAEKDWWAYLRTSGQIAASFTDQPGDRGEQVLKKYIKGDHIIAYASGYGAVGWGTIEKPQSYRLLTRGEIEDKQGGKYLHRLSICWGGVAPSLDRGIPPAEVRDHYGIHHPRTTSVPIDRGKATRLIEEMNRRFDSGANMRVD